MGSISQAEAGMISQPEPEVASSGMGRILGGIQFVAVALLVAMTGTVCYEVISRYGFGAPTEWSTEYSTYMFVAVVFLGFSVAQTAGAHIQVEALQGILKPRLRTELELVATWLGILFTMMAGWQMARFNADEFVFGTRGMGLLPTPQWIPELPVTFGYLAFILAQAATVLSVRRPKGSIRLWLAPLIFVIVTALLVYLGRHMVMVVRPRFDLGTLSIFAGVFCAALAWSGWRTAGLLAALGLVLGGGFTLAAGGPMPVVGGAIVLSLMLLLVLGVRVGIAMGTVGMLGLLLLAPRPLLAVLSDRSWTSINSFTLTAIPTFVFMGSLLVRSGITEEMFDTLVRWFGRLPGGLAHAGISASAVFAAVSGSSIATAATLGSVAAPELVSRGYSPRLTYGLVAAGATLGILIPPSIAMIIYGNIVGVPVTQLFLAGIVPGLCLTGLFMLVVVVWSFVAPSAVPEGRRYSMREKLTSLVNIVPFVLIIGVVLGSLYAGVATPTEAGAVGAMAALVLCLVRGRLTWREFYDTAASTVRVVGFLGLIIVGASIMSWVFDYLRLPRAMVAVVEEAHLSPGLVMLMIALVYLVLGMFVESISMMLMTLSVTFPIIVSLGLDPIWFGVVLVILVEIGLITPPVGIVLFVLKGMSNVQMKDIVIGVLPFIAVMLGFLVVLYFYPQIVLALPNAH